MKIAVAGECLFDKGYFYFITGRPKDATESVNESYGEISINYTSNNLKTETRNLEITENWD